MATRTVVSCDVCGTDKAVVNHWYAVWLGIDDSSFNAVPLHKAPAISASTVHACGAAHATTLFQRWLQSGTLEMEVHHKIQIPKEATCMKHGNSYPCGECEQAPSQLYVSTVTSQKTFQDDATCTDCGRPRDLCICKYK